MDPSRPFRKPGLVSMTERLLPISARAPAAAAVSAAAASSDSPTGQGGQGSRMGFEGHECSNAESVLQLPSSESPAQQGRLTFNAIKAL